MSRKRTTRQWTKLLDKEFSKLVREKQQCEHCGSTTSKFDCAHVIGRVNKTLRWDIMNAMCLCFRCHLYFWHSSPLEATKWFVDKFPERHDYLIRAKNITIKRTDGDYQEILDAIRNKDFEKLVVPKEVLEKLYK